MNVSTAIILPTAAVQKLPRSTLIAGVILAVFVQAVNAIGFFFLLPRIAAAFVAMGGNSATFLTTKSFLEFAQFIQQIAWVGVPTFFGLAGWHIWAICHKDSRHRWWGWLVASCSMMLWFVLVAYLAMNITLTTLKMNAH